jgi:S1-C subfamily serine protease
MQLTYAPVGRAYALGRGVPPDFKQAIFWLKKCDDKAWQIQRLAEQYATGDEVSKDGTKAIDWYQVLADEGFDYGLEKIGQLYLEGDCVRRDFGQALEWFLKAAKKGAASAQNSVGELYAKGLGVAKDEIEALAWFYLAASKEDSRAIRNQHALEQQLGRDVALAAQQRSKELAKILSAKNEPGETPRLGDATSAQPPALPKFSGSGAIVSSRGYVVTAAHVVAAGAKITVLTAQGMKPATVVRLDEANDLAVLKLADGTYPSLPVASSRQVRLGQTVATIGFPNINIQGFSPKVTRGEISSLNGIGDDPRAWQISVPVQPGNSGGALLDENGSVIGVVVSKLGLKAFKATGDIPQNVNYAVKSTYALALLEPYLESTAPESNQSAAKPRFEDMVAKAQQSVVLILVY